MRARRPEWSSSAWPRASRRSTPPRAIRSGRSEEILGRIVASMRDQVVICTKVGGGSALPGALGKEAVLRSAEESLRRLGTDHIDVYYLHRPDRATPIEETLDALATLLDQQRIRAIGLSNFSSWQVLHVSHLAAQAGLPEIAATQPIYNLLVRRIESEYAELTRVLGIPNIVYNPLAGGLLTGKHDFEAALPEEGRFTNKRYVRRYWKPEVFEAVNRLSVRRGERRAHPGRARAALDRGPTGCRWGPARCLKCCTARAESRRYRRPRARRRRDAGLRRGMGDPARRSA